MKSEVDFNRLDKDVDLFLKEMKVSKSTNVEIDEGSTTDVTSSFPFKGVKIFEPSTLFRAISKLDSDIQKCYFIERTLEGYKALLQEEITLFNETHRNHKIQNSPIHSMNTIRRLFIQKFYNGCEYIAYSDRYKQVTEDHAKYVCEAIRKLEKKNEHFTEIKKLKDMRLVLIGRFLEEFKQTGQNGSKIKFVEEQMKNLELSLSKDNLSSYIGKNLKKGEEKYKEYKLSGFSISDLDKIISSSLESWTFSKNFNDD